MTGYLRQIAARSAGLSAVSTTEMTPPRVSAFSIPTPLGPPRPYPLPDEAGSPLDSQTAPAQSNADVKTTAAQFRRRVPRLCQRAR
jgi:hypothetical protein